MTSRLLKRRDWLGWMSSASGAALLTAHAPGWAQALDQRAASLADRILVLIELKGGNDGLNTVVPYADPEYAALRGSIAIRPDELVALDARQGLHPQLKPLVPMWEKGQLGIVQNVGYPQPNLSHFRSIEIWQTGSSANEYLQQGWIARAMKAGYAATAAFTAEGVSIGSNDMGSLLGARAVSLNNPQAFVSQAHLATPLSANGSAALQHVLMVESEINQAAAGLRGQPYAFVTAFPQGAFGQAVQTACQVVASQRGKAGVPVISLTLGSFDTHRGQLGQHAALLRQLAEGIVAMQQALTELGAWDRTLVMTYSEFGRRPRQNNSGGTDHGTSAPHFVAGGAVRGGWYGTAPDLSRLDTAQNLLPGTDFRQLYATIARDWWGVDPELVVRGKFEPLKFLHA